MLVSSRTITLGLAIAALALTPAAAVAKHGADDGPTHNAADDKGGQRDDAADDKGGQRDDATGGDDSTRKGKRVSGTCSDSSSAKLKVKPDDGRLEAEFEVDQNTNGVRWAVRIRRNGALVVKTSAITKAPSGSFSVERRFANPAGSDRISARATSPSGEVCRASITI